MCSAAAFLIGVALDWSRLRAAGEGASVVAVLASRGIAVASASGMLAAPSLLKLGFTEGPMRSVVAATTADAAGFVSVGTAVEASGAGCVA